MPDTDPLSPDAIDEMWARFEREVGPAASALSPADRAMLAVLYVARDRSVTVKQARELVVRASVVGGPTSIPSESTSSRHRERLEAILHAAAPPLDAGADADAATILRAAIGGQSYPAFCPALAGGLLPPLDALLACAGAARVSTDRASQHGRVQYSAGARRPGRRAGRRGGVRRAGPRGGTGPRGVTRASVRPRAGGGRRRGAQRVEPRPALELSIVGALGSRPHRGDVPVLEQHVPHG